MVWSAGQWLCVVKMKVYTHKTPERTAKPSAKGNLWWEDLSPPYDNRVRDRKIGAIKNDKQAI